MGITGRRCVWHGEGGEECGMYATVVVARLGGTMSKAIGSARTRRQPSARHNNGARQCVEMGRFYQRNHQKVNVGTNHVPAQKEWLGVAVGEVWGIEK